MASSDTGQELKEIDEATNNSGTGEPNNTNLTRARNKNKGNQKKKIVPDGEVATDGPAQADGDKLISLVPKANVSGKEESRKEKPANGNDHSASESEGNSPHHKGEISETGGDGGKHMKELPETEERATPTKGALSEAKGDIASHKVDLSESEDVVSQKGDHSQTKGDIVQHHGADRKPEQASCDNLMDEKIRNLEKKLARRDQQLNKIKEKDADIKSYLKVINEHKATITDYEVKLKEARGREVRLQEEIEHFQSKVEENATEIKELHEKKIQKERMSLTELREVGSRQNEVLEREKIQLENKVKNLESKNGNQMKTIRDHLDQLKRVRKQKEKAETYATELEKRAAKEKDDANKRIKDLEKRSKKDKEDAKKRIEDLGKERKQLNIDLNTLKKENNDMKTNLHQYADGYHRATTDVSRLSAENYSLTKEIQTLRNTKISLEAEKDTLLLRLSKIAGANLTYNNPNIADLSDEKRPTKLAEEFSELYDNEWTDAFEEVEGTGDESKTGVLYDLLKKAYTYCVELSAGHEEAIQGSFTTLNYIRTLPKSQGETNEVEHSTTNENDQNIDQSPDVVSVEEQVDQMTDKRKDANTTKTGDQDAGDFVVLESPVTDGASDSSTIDDAEEVTKDKVSGDVSNTVTQLETKETKIPTDAPNEESDTEPDTTDNEKCMSEAETNVASDFDEKNAVRSDVKGTANEKNVVVESGNNVESETGPGAVETELNVNTNVADNVTEEVEQEAGNNKSTDTANDENNVDAVSKFKDDDDSTTTVEDVKDDCPNCKDTLHVESKTDEPITTTMEISKVDFKFDDLSKEQKKMIMDIKKVCEIRQSTDVTKIGTELIAEEMDIKKESHALMNYISKCIDICWSMYRHVPPVYIAFSNYGPDEPFDTKMYRAYTKSGKSIQFVVWPAIHLHEGGPLLAKGVAQGRK